MTRGVWGFGLLTAAGVLLVSAHLIAETPWTELRGEGFAVRGQVSTDTLTAVACDLETAVKALRRSTTGGGVPQVVAVDNARGIREWLPQFNERGRGNPLGAYWRGLYGDHIVVRVDAPPPERLRRVLHEYAHFVTHLTHPEPAPWLDEGISEVWEHVAITTGTIQIGRPVTEHLKRLRSNKDWIPVREVIAANVIPTRTSEMFYAESWALAHYLMFQEGGGRVVLDRLPDTADLPTDAALRAYVLGPMGAVVTISTAAGACPGQTAVDQVPAPRALLDRAQALADGERPETALPVLQEILVLDRNNTEVVETIGFVHFKGNRPVEAAGVFDGVIASGRASHISYYYRAVLAGPVPDRSDGGGRISEVEYLRKALALNPGFAPAVQRLRELTGRY